ncbi:MAG: ribosomal protein S18-alanine N-acetyltransferase [Candidatus Cloacimonetes bacterium]|nr:ribosomal protein S18-alanine N-acetyltransferase [Candidatus Cloacimonadota bacterium]
MDLEPQIRPRQDSDLPQILKIENQVFRPPWPEEAFQENDFTRFWVLCSGDKLLGYIIYHVVPDEVVIVNFAIDPDFWRRGLGNHLLGHTLRLIRAEGVNTFYLDVRRSNQAALDLYGKYGFRRLGVRKNYYSEPPEDAIVMVRNFAG